jgi:recombinational DNA repair protein RecR
MFLAQNNEGYLLSLHAEKYFKITPNLYSEIRKFTERILLEHKEHPLLNFCPTCHKLARTPQAKQCRFCSHSWRNAETS